MIDTDNKVHFPGHAEVSYNVFKHLFPSENQAADLILHDMDLHTLKADQIPLWYEQNKELVISLLITSLAEIHSNAAMFGGLDSTSFKIKHKCITQRGKQIFSLM